MAGANLTSRLEALERFSSASHAMAVYLIADAASDAEHAERRTQALATWERGHGQPFPTSGKVLAVVLCGPKPQSEAAGRLQ